jgi:glutamate--cysteine ligase
MSTLQQRLAALPADRLAGMRRGIEKEGLRVLPTGGLALTPHPAALGSALTHGSITTDYSESQLELITGAHGTVQACLDELQEVHQFVHRVLAQQQPGGEMLWVSSMPCMLPTDETIPLGRYGGSNIGRAKSVYRMGLGHRYGRRMQTISGIHYNWSLPGLGSDDYFALIRNFRRHAFVLLYLFGASPALCPCFVAGRDHSLQPLAGPADAATCEGARALHLPHATSLRMGRLGYQSDAATWAANTTSSAPACCRSRTSSTAPSAPSAPCKAASARCTRCASAAWNTWRCASWTSTRSSPWASRPRPCGCWTCSCCTACCPTARPTRPRKSPRSSATST